MAIKWQEMRDYVRHEVEEAMLIHACGDLLITECPQCGTRYPHQIGRIDAVERITDLVVKRMKEQNEGIVKTLMAYIQMVESGGL